MLYCVPTAGEVIRSTTAETGDLVSRSNGKMASASDHAMRNPHIPPHFWRGLNNNQNAIYLECFIDELAHTVGHDPSSSAQADDEPS
jgi:hypothetical protein